MKHRTTHHFNRSFPSLFRVTLEPKLPHTAANANPGIRIMDIWPLI